MTENLTDVAEAGGHEPLVDPQPKKSWAGSPPVIEQPMEGCSTFFPFEEKPYTEKLETRNLKPLRKSADTQGNKNQWKNLVAQASSLCKIP